MADDNYVVKCALAQLRTADGSYVHIYEGGPVPELFEGDRELLHEQGLIGLKDEEFDASYVDPKTQRKVGRWTKVKDADKDTKRTADAGAAK